MTESYAASLLKDIHVGPATSQSERIQVAIAHALVDIAASFATPAEITAEALAAEYERGVEDAQQEAVEVARGTAKAVLDRVKNAGILDADLDWVATRFSAIREEFGVQATPGEATRD